VRIATTLSAHTLLGVLKAIEREHGREPDAPRDHPRPLDLDLLLFGDERFDTRSLVVPHPRLHEREFVLAPLRALGVDVAALPRQERPLVVRTPEDFSALCTRWLQGGCEVGLVPTMGALHEGHASLARRARAECDRVAATIFVNPLQFAPHEDLATYPRTLAADLALLRAAGTDAVFVPGPDAMYGTGFASAVSVGSEAMGMEGTTRPEHFRGVATVVAKLLALARPTRAYFGEKDAQQLAVIERMVSDLGFPTEVRRCATVREADGLARSSRNVFLQPADRAAAPVLHRALLAVRDAHARGECDDAALAALGGRLVQAEPRAELDYFEVLAGRAYVAARFGGGGRVTRLIDNMQLGPDA
jgi:pantoate--beta-alanine ligase